MPEDSRGNEPKRVSIVVDDLSASPLIRAYLIARALRRLGHQCEIVGFQSRGDLYSELPPAVSLKPVPIAPGSPPLTLIRALLKEIRGQVVYAVKLRAASFGLSLLARAAGRRRLIVDIDDWEPGVFGFGQSSLVRSLGQLARRGAWRNANQEAYLRLLERLAPLADARTVNTRCLQQRFGGVYLPSGKDTAIFDPALYDPEECRRQLGLASYRVLLFPGAPRAYKGLEDVLAALDRLGRDDLRLVLVGGNPYDDYDQELMRRWGSWIIKLPRRPVEQMPRAVASAHIVVVPQRDSPVTRAQFPLKLTDGMAMAKPVLTTRVGDIPEIVGDTAYLVEPGRPDQLAGAIEFILGHPDEAKEKGLAARQRCVQLYSIEAMSAILQAVV